MVERSSGGGQRVEEGFHAHRIDSLVKDCVLDHGRGKSGSVRLDARWISRDIWFEESALVGDRKAISMELVTSVKV